MTVIKHTDIQLLSYTCYSLSCCCPTLHSRAVLCHTKLQSPLQTLILIRAAGVFLLLHPHRPPVLGFVSPSNPYTGSSGWSWSGCCHDGAPCRRTGLHSTSGPCSGSGCCCCCSVRSSPPLSCSGPPLSALRRPPPRSPRLPEESSRSARRPAWPTPQRAAERREEAERLWA